MKLTTDFLKQESCNFDLECVFTLDLSEKGITDLDGLKECINLEILNLSFNDIKDLTVFRNLPKLQILNLSNNLIRSIDGLEGLECLQMLNLSGNYIHNINEFQKLENLKELNQLKLVDKRKKTTNPVCSSNKNYIQDINHMLPHIEIIDGENLKFQSPNKMLDQEDQYEKNSKLFENYNNCNESWLKNNLLKIEFTEKEKSESLLNEQRVKFKNIYEDVKSSIQDTNNYLNNLESS